MKSKPRYRLHFLGAARTVTGSMHLFEYCEKDEFVRFAVDSGMDQENEGRNHQNRLLKGMKASELDFVILTHAHLDHGGYLPRLVKEGFRGQIYATLPTRDLLEISLLDSGKIQVEEYLRLLARAKNKRGKTDNSLDEKNQEIIRKPLYTELEVKQCLSQVITVDFDELVKPAKNIQFRFARAGHLLGAATVDLELGSGSKKRRFRFTGDLGRKQMPVIKDPEIAKKADYVICEGTYGDRQHKKRDRLANLASLINQAYERAIKTKDKPEGAGVILIPASAMGRVQHVLYDLSCLMYEHKIPSIPVFVDSPMANKSTAIYRAHLAELNEKARKRAVKNDIFSTPEYTEIIDFEKSLELDKPSDRPIIIVSSSGMATGGRVIRHLSKRLSGWQNTVIFVGFQPEGTLGRRIIERKIDVTIAGQIVQMKAAVEYLPDYSGHADSDDIIAWLKHFEPKPRLVVLTHGKLDSLEVLKGRIEKEIGSKVLIPELKDHVDFE